ncbi:Hsp20/alpha crystallin family protein [Desulfolutivibrio sulfoxidireducens]|uniref:Hsp20/alpha crystallin family protein n=1 Tax=Desulfolutivibrio sulfoxidireducens TaxID=2773299 RepID=UPI00159E6C37|nr:Hsp20/alpha crystallin family protein [Desulfolutivibrio sulfoxidireducens]QLA17745.1 Hsp20 family protein [Desulfolutivibrio sulfoxidireducens]QLA21321.1 Hsp20 family protein [Desulfolutivibrio sulfoxidireducens]
MDYAKLNPWNWFKKEDEQDKSPSVRPDEPPAKRPFPASPFFGAPGDMDTFMDRAFRTFGLPAAPWTWPFGGSKEGEVARPRVDITGSEKEYTISAELPGIEEKDIQVELKGDALVIKAEKTQEEKTEDKGYYRMERRYGSFRRVLAVPGDADVEGVKAGYKNGVLTITMPRKASVEAETKRIAIE